MEKVEEITGKHLASGTGAALHPPSVYSRGSVVVIERGAQMPDRCVRCNAAASLPKVQQRLVIADRRHKENSLLLSLIPFVGRRARQFYRWQNRDELEVSACVDVGLCLRHKLLRMLWPVIVFAGIIAAGIPFRFGISSRDPNGLLILAGFAILVLTILAVAWARKTVRPHQIEPNAVTIAGAAPAFIQSLPLDPKPAAAAASAAALTAAIRRRGEKHA